MLDKIKKSFDQLVNYSSKLLIKYHITQNLYKTEKKN